MLSDPLAQLLYDSLFNGRAIAPGSEWVDIDTARAKRIARELYQHCGTTPGAWKIGALEPELQRAMGLSEPLVAPLLRTAVRKGIVETDLDLSQMFAPRFEAELGISRSEGQISVCACIEVVDTRFEDWRLPKLGPMMDFGMQGLMLFGPEQPALASEYSVEVRFNGEKQASGSLSLDEAVSRTDLVSEPSGAPLLVATGTMVGLLDAEPARWVFDYGALGSIALEVHR